MTNSNLFNYVTKSKNASESLAAFYSLSDRKIIDIVEVKDIKDKILTCSQYAAIKTQPQGLKCKDTFYIDGLALSGYMLFMVSKFIKTQKSVKIYRNKENWAKSWEIIGDNATMVFMPLKVDNDVITGQEENPYSKIYDSSKNIVVDNVKAA